MIVDGILSQIFRSKVKDMDYNMKQEAMEDVGYPTGYLNFDFMNGYQAQGINPATGQLESYFSIGLTDGSYVAVLGFTGTGKTTWVCQAAANIVRQFKTSTIFEDSLEGGLTHERRRSLSKFSQEEYKARYIIRNTGINAENFYQRIKMIHDLKTKHPENYNYDTGYRDRYGQPIIKLEPTIYIVDSIALLMPKTYTEEDELAGKSAGAASALVVTNIFRTILPMLKAANIILFGINHILEDVNMTVMPKKNPVPGLKQGERIPKGRTVTFLANNIIRIDNVGKFKPDEGYHIEGSLTNVSLVKSRSSGKKLGTNLVFDFDNGFCPWLSLLRFMQDQKLIYGGGASMSLDPEKTYKFSLGNFREKIFTDENFRQYFLNAALPILKAIPAEKDVLAQDDHITDLLSAPNIFSI